MSNNYNGIPESESPRVVSVGHGNFVIAGRIVVVLGASGNPMKRLREKATQDNLLIDATAGRKTKSVIVMDNRHIVLSALSPQTLQERLVHEKPHTPAQQEWQEGQFAS